ncbi:MAG: RNA polymerase sigma factor [Filomicrobium sp.]
MFGKKSSDAQFRRGLSELFPRLWRYCIALTVNRPDADDLAQAACLRALERFDKFTPGTRLDSWVFCIAHRIWLNELRAARIRRGGGIAPIEDLDLVDETSDVEMNISAREVLRSVMRLPEAQRIMVLLVYVEGFSYKEAAEIAEVPIGTVMSRLASARKTLTAADNERSSKKA